MKPARSLFRFQDKSTPKGAIEGALGSVIWTCETVQEVLEAAAIGTDGFRTGMVAITATSRDLLNLDRHRHQKTRQCVVSSG